MAIHPKTRLFRKDKIAKGTRKSTLLAVGDTKKGVSLEKFWKTFALENKDMMPDADWSCWRFSKHIMRVRGTYWNESYLYIPAKNEDGTRADHHYIISFYS